MFFTQSILQTIAPNWSAEGTKLSQEYAEILEAGQLITKAELEGYKLTPLGHKFSSNEDPLLVTKSFKEINDRLKAVFDSQ